MSDFHIESIQYTPNSTAYFEILRALKLEYPIFLDSSWIEASSTERHPNQRFDILSAAPQDWISLDARGANSATLDIITDWLEQHQQALNLSEQQPILPFTGGAICAFSYELGQLVTNQTLALKEQENFPLFQAGFYNWAIVQDHLAKKAFWVSIITENNDDIYLIKQLIKEEMSSKLSSLNNAKHHPKHDPKHDPKHEQTDRHFRLNKPLLTQIQRQDYVAQFKKIQDYILSGDSYQVNLAQHYHGRYEGDPWQAYKRLRSVAQAPFSAYWETEQQTILCASPERFLSMQARTINSKPIKGTRPRCANPEEDRQLAMALSNSIKDCAENLMIVDLLRNDLGKNCIPGSVTVDSLFAVESFSTVHHLVSEISGTLNDDCSHVSAFLDCFPGGSITGAPKIRAMQIIAELEAHARQLYCGSIAYFSSHGHSDSNICIRTFICQANKDLVTWAGGGIVSDSDCDKEHAECGYKIDRLIHALTH